MSVVVPPPVVRPDEQEELEALIRAARARQRRRRRIGAAALVVLLAGSAIAVYSIANSGGSGASKSGRPTTPVRTTKKCGIRVAGPRILGSDGGVVYREPIRHQVNSDRAPSQVQCSGETVWVVWDNGAGMSQEGYVGARSSDSGRTWHLVFSEPFFGVKAPHALDAYFGPWSLRGPEVAYFVGSCPACSAGRLSGTVSLWVTKDGGRTFRRYDVSALDGYGASRMRISGHSVTIVGQRFNLNIPPRKTVTLRVA